MIRRLLHSTFYILHSRKGFTLIELLVFSVIFSGIMIAFISILVTIISIQTHQSSVTEVTTQSNYLLQKVEYLVERSSLIELPQDTSTTTLKLRMPASAEDPTLITLSNGIVYLQQGTGPQNQLTSNKVVVSALSFNKHSNPPGHDSVSVSFLVSYNSPSIKQQFSETLNTAIARASAATFDANLIPSSTATFDLGVPSNLWRSVNNVIYFSGSNVGIGTTNPLERLSIAGVVSGHLAERISNTEPTGYSTLWLGPGNDGLFRSGGSASFNTDQLNLLTSLQVPIAIVTSNTTRIFIAGTGNVGIGTANPLDTLHVVAPASQTGGLTLSGPGAGMRIYNTDATVVRGGLATALNNDSYGFGNVPGDISLFAWGGKVNFATGAATGTNGTVRMTVATSGYVGIGTLAPNYTLDVNGTINASVSSAVTTSSNSFWNASESALIVQNPDTTIGAGAKILFTKNDTGGVGYAQGGIALINTAANNGGTLVFATRDVSGLNTEKMRITDTGNVGIGTTSPLSKLGVNGGVAIGTYAATNAAPANGLLVSGDAHFGGAPTNIGLGTYPLTVTGASGGQVQLIVRDGGGASSWSGALSVLYVASDAVTGRSIAAGGSINANGLDFAEYFYQQTPGVLVKGDVACLSDLDKKVVKCDVAHTNIMGVVSTKPGYVGNDIYDPKHPDDTALVGLIGQVPVKVSEENGPIQSGDPLAASKIMSGYAMKMTEAGRSIGIAEESSTGKDKILAFVNSSYWAPRETPSSFLAKTSEALKGLGIAIENSIAHMSNLVADFIETHTLKAEYIIAPNGITTKDAVSGQPYCMRVANGQVQALPGECQ